jgi:Rrf2 family protein
MHMAKKPGKLHQADDIAKSQDVPPSFLGKILQRLAGAGIVISKRGRNGGFIMACRPSEITLLDVVEVIQGPIAVNDCLAGHKSCARRGRCSLSSMWGEISDGLKGRLMKYDFAAIAANDEPVAFRRKLHERA